MSRLSDRISEILKQAHSAKITDKKRCVSELLDLYQNEDALKKIWQNTERNAPGIVNWSYITYTIHKLVLDEAERQTKETNARSNERQAICGLLINTIRKFNERSIKLLKNNDIIPMILQILDSKTYVHYQDTYLGILVSYILPKNTNHIYITTEQWRELLIVCTKLYKKGSVKKHNVLDALRMIVKYSFSHANLLLNVKDLVLFLESIFKDVKANNEQLAVPFYKLSDSIYRNVATESRITLCKFSEDILADILHFSDTEEKYRLLHAFLQIHHPDGAWECDEGAYACDWNKWRDLLRSMCLLIQQNCKLDVRWKSFIEFASEVVKQMVDNAENFAIPQDINIPTSSHCQPVKRRRVFNRMCNIVDLIIESSPEEIWSLTIILRETLRKYPRCLKPQDLPVLLQRLTELVQSRDEAMMDNFYKLAIVLMQNEMSTEEVHDSVIYWNKVWDMLLRSLGANQNEESGHALIRCFIKYNKMPNPNALLKLYLTKAIRWSPISVRTLLQLCKHVSLSENASESVIGPSPPTTTICDRTRLLEWLLDAPWQKLAVRLPIEDLCNLLADIVLSSHCRQNARTDLLRSIRGQRSKHSYEEERAATFLSSDIQAADLSRLCHSSLILNIQELLTKPEDNRAEEDFRIVAVGRVSCVQEAFDFLRKRSCEIFHEETSNDEVYVVLIKVAFLARLLSVLKRLGILTESIADRFMIETMEKHLENSFEVLANIDSGRCKYMYLVNVTRALSVLYGGTYDTSIAQIIVSASTENTLKNIFDLLNLDDAHTTDYRRNCDYYEECGTSQERRRRSSAYWAASSNIPSEGVIRLQVIKALASFCAMHVGENKRNLQTKLMRNLLTMQQDFTDCVEFRMSMTILESLSKRDQSEMRQEYADAPLLFVLEVCKRDPKNEEIVRRLLRLLPFFFGYATKYHYSPKRIIQAFSALYKSIHRRNCGILVHSAYMKCVYGIVQMDPYFSWSGNDAEDVVLMLDSVLHYISDPIFILRSQAVQCFQQFLSLKDVAYEWKERMFVKVEEIVLKLFDVEQRSKFISRKTIEECQQEDDEETRVVTALVTLASVVSVSGVLRGRALYTMLRLVAEIKAPMQQVQKVVAALTQQTTSPNLIEDNLNYLLTSWINAEYPLQKFPWMIVGNETIDRFFKKHVNRVVPIILRSSSLDEAVSFCTNIGATFCDVFEDIFPCCFTWLISRAYDQTLSPLDNTANRTLEMLVNNLDEFTSVRSFPRLFCDNLENVLVEILRRLHDEEHFERIFSIPATFPELDPPHFSKAAVERCFDCLERHFLERPLTRLLAEEKPAMLQRILLELVTAVHVSQTSEGRLKNLHQYIYFCSLLMRDLEKSFFDEMSAFIIRDICYCLLHMTEINDEGNLLTASCKFLGLFLKHVLPARAAEIGDVLKFIVAKLIGLGQRSGSAEIALDLLQFLIVEQKNVLREAIAKLSSFPNLKIFEDVRNAHNNVRYKDGVVCLEDELERFLDVMSEENAECTLEDLANLTQQLTTRKMELKRLREKLERPYPEDGTNILHRLIFRLVKLTELPSPSVSMEATRCLGELGPMNLTLAFRPIESLVQETDCAIEALTYRSVAMLTSFLVENTVQLRKVSAEALHAILSSTIGRKLSDPKYSKYLSDVLGGFAPLRIDYIRPFVNDTVKKDSFHVNVSRFRTIMDPANALWSVKYDQSYPEWIVKITCSIVECFEGSYLESSLPVCLINIEFCELILPRIIYLTIRQSENFIVPLCDCVNQFFRYQFAINHEGETTTLTSEKSSCDRKIVRRMLDVVNHVRTQLPDGVNLKLDYIYLAKAAHWCSAYYTALLFVQLACESISIEYPDFSSDPKIDYIYAHHPALGRVLQDIMQDTYLNISDPDAACGAGSSHLLDRNSRIRHYSRTNKWNEIMLELSYGNLLAAKEMANALHRSGLLFSQWQYLGESKDLDEKFSYECAWRLGNWDLLVNDAGQRVDESIDLRLESLENAFYEHHYHALKCFHQNDQRGTERAIESARESVIRSLRVVSLESSKTINEKLSQLRLLREIEQLSSANLEEYPKVLRHWEEHEIPTNQFEYVEPILTQRIMMFRIKESIKGDSDTRQAFFSTCLHLATIAKDQDNFLVAAKALGTLARYPNLSQVLQDQVHYQESLLAWTKCDRVIARRRLRSLIERRDLKSNLKAEALRVYGDWMVETKSENPQAVIQKYYLESIAISNNIEKQTPDVIKDLHDAQVALARFADAQYEQISSYMKSPIYESLKENAEYARNAVRVDQAQMIKNRDIKRAVIISHKQSTNDAAEVKNIEQERQNYLSQALTYYLKVIRQSDEHNLLIFRLIALWLDNMFDEDVNELLHELDTVPSFKFVPLVPQLAAHVSNDLTTSFSKRIFQILERCALEHPHHTLPVILALKNSHNDDKYDSGAVAKKEERRVLGAKKLLKRLIDSPARYIVREMEILSEALVSLAYWQPKGKCHAGKLYQIPRDQPITKVKNLNNTLMSTLSLPVKPSGNYANIVGVGMYRETCEFVGGVNAPKKIICIGTDGIQRRQLIKGKDDLRQDAVMQQVFTVVNTLLRTCKETNRRKLRIRTYKVVPLTQRSGVLEWCDNTLPITTTLMGSEGTSGMHKKYYPNDLTAEAARNKIKNVAQELNEVKLKVFLECCKRLRPAFHHFFEEKYRSPEIWVERTLTYTRSVATTSIAGYILGLGDRHLSNILIDEQTAEVVHIDFGIAFEQGKVLPLPETIPFRLTRDIEVAMGASGIEGTMRRSCEEIMTMLRCQRQIIITLLQVLLYDPLFAWAITPEKACKVQSDAVKNLSESGRAPMETNKIAKRALLRIEQKLQGTEEGLVSSVSGQVERLLQEARDPANLCRLYCGWQPYL